MRASAASACAGDANDGSKDNTQAVLEQLVSASGQATLLSLNQNGGKAAAVRAGMLHAQTVHSDCEYFGFWDADLSTPLEELNWYHDFSGGELAHKLIIGSRISRLGAKVQRKMIRHYLGRIFSTLASNLLHRRRGRARS